MTNARKSIFDRMRRRLQTNSSESVRAAKSRIALHERGPLPQWNSNFVYRFIEKLTAAAGTYELISSSAGLPESITRYLTHNKLGGSILLAPHPILESLTWPDDITVTYGTASASDVVTVSVAAYGIAETGSLVMLSCAQTPTSLNFLSDHFLCVLDQRDIVNYMEDAWQRWRDGSGHTPRVVNMITGPSRTADVEQIIQLGAHGPRQLHVLLIEHN